MGDPVPNAFGMRDDALFGQPQGKAFETLLNIQRHGGLAVKLSEFLIAYLLCRESDLCSRFFEIPLNLAYVG